MNELEFYCRDCESTFRSEPDGTGYDQAACPACREICMTVQFEQEEQQRNQNEATLFSYLGQLTGMFSAKARDAPDHKSHVDDQPQEPSPISDPVTVCSFQNTSEATECCAILDESGISSQLVQEEDTETPAPDAADHIDLQVAKSDARRAHDVINEYRAAKNQTSTAERHDDQIVFDCEECSGVLSFPADRQGGVEICSHCGEFVDVPD